MSEKGLVALVGVLYTLMFCWLLYLCGGFFDALKADSESQRRAAWAQVYWAKRGRLMAEKDGQERWEALHAEDYCRQKLQEAEAVKEPAQHGRR